MWGKRLACRMVRLHWQPGRSPHVGPLLAVYLAAFSPRFRGSDARRRFCPSARPIVASRSPLQTRRVSVRARGAVVRPGIAGHGRGAAARGSRAGPRWWRAGAGPRPRPSKPRKKPVERHLTGQELCEAARQDAIQQYGYLARTVLGTWGLRNTADFGEIVFNMIEIGQMRKTRKDRREDFHDVYDFQDAFCRDCSFVVPDKA